MAATRLFYNLLYPASTRGSIFLRQTYQRASTLAGALHERTSVGYVPTLNRRERMQLAIWGFVIIMTSLILLGWIATGTTVSTIGVITVLLMLTIEAIRLMQTATLWAFARRAVDPIPMTPQRGLRVAVHTTIVPAKEPFDIVARTLLAMKQMRYDGGAVDVWLLDEGNDPDIKDWCDQHGIFHFSRKGIEEWNTRSGAFKAKTKHGNLNSFHAAHGATYDIVAQMDPDHAPSVDFLERTLGYFADPNVGFVVAPQVYGNLKESFIARASAFQAYVFHGIIQRGGNGLRAPLLIGTNHLVRVKALRDIGGYADNIIEDHLTSMAMFAKKNENGAYWAGVYTPDIVSVGEGPASFTDYFNQQKRWAYGVWEIAQSHSPNMLGGMRPAQRLAFAMLQFFYPSVAVSWLLSFVLCTMYMTGSVEGRSILEWAVAWGSSMASSIGFFWWLRRFNLVEHERKDWGFGGMALLMMCIPVYVAAGIQAILRKPLTYAVTAKGNLASPDSLRTFRPHLVWASVIAGMLALSLFGIGSTFLGTRLWLAWMTGVCLSPVVVYLAVRRLRTSRFPVSRHDTHTSNVMSTDHQVPRELVATVE